MLDVAKRRQGQTVSCCKGLVIENGITMQAGLYSQAYSSTKGVSVLTASGILRS